MNFFPDQKISIKVSRAIRLCKCWENLDIDLIQVYK